MELPELVPLLEAMLFSADQPCTVNSLAKAIRVKEVDGKRVREGLKELQSHLEASDRGVRLHKFGNGYQILTREEYAPTLERFLLTKRRIRLSRAALETAAVIAYKEPISRIEIERVRGVDAGGVLTTLLERGLIMIKGRDPGPGRPLLYGTTQAFLDYFGLTKLSDLPRLDELAELAGLDAQEWSDRERQRFEKFGVDVEAVPVPENLDAVGDEEGPVGPDEEELPENAGVKEEFSKFPEQEPSVSALDDEARGPVADPTG